MAAADLLFHSKRLFDDGAIAELKIWALPEPVLGSTHGLKYSLYYGQAKALSLRMHGCSAT